MADTFNAYHKWLGIPRKDQPPNHYRLLGIELFEADEDVISAAADQRMVYLRSFQSGKHAAAAETLLNEIAAARICLLSPERREPYDRELRAKSSTLPAPRAMLPGAALQEQQLASLRKAAHDSTRSVPTETQEVALAPAPLPGDATPVTERTPAPLPVANYVLPSTTSASFPALKPPPRPVCSVEATTPSPAPWNAADVLAQLPQRIVGAAVFLVRLPGDVARWMLRSADRALLDLVGEENRILHNFLRVIVPTVLLTLLTIGGFFGVSWGGPRIIAALRERAAQRIRDAEANRLATSQRVAPEFVMLDTEPPLSTSMIPPPVVPPTLPPENPGTDTPAVVEEPPPSDEPPSPRNRPIFTTHVLRSQTAAVQPEIDAFARMPDADIEAVDRQIGGFPYRHALRSLAHTFTFTPDADSIDEQAFAEIIAQGINTVAKRRLFAARAADELKRPGPDWQGIVAFGSVQQKFFGDGLYRTEVELRTQPLTTVTVVSDRNLAESFVARSSVFVVGSVVDRPDERIVGYKGPQQPVIWGGCLFAAPPLSEMVASVSVDPPAESPVEEPATPEEPAEPEIVAAPVDPDADLIALARYATALQNTGQLLQVPDTHPLVARWVATGLVRRERKRSWGMEQVEGEPDTLEFGDRSSAWASRSQDTGEEWLDLRYAATVTPAQVVVFETHCPGALVAITGFRGEREIDLWRGVDPTPATSRGGTSNIKIADSFPTSHLRIYLDSAAVGGWNEIDAVGIVDDRGRKHWATVVMASSCYAGDDHPPLAIDRSALLQVFARRPDLMKQLRQELKLEGTDFNDEKPRRRPRRESP